MTSLEPTIGLGIDAGGSATRWVLSAGNGEIIVRGEVTSMSGHVSTELGRAKMMEALTGIKQSVDSHPKPSRILAGITGVSAGSSSALIIRNYASLLFNIASSNVAITTDLWVTYQSYFMPGHGIVVYSGTGSAAIHIAEDMTVFRAGGFGHLIDDAGSGYAIGREALKAVLRTNDREPNSGWKTGLGRRLATLLGEASWPAVRKSVYGGDRSTISFLAQAVGEAAVYDRDVAAERILLSAGADLAELARTLRHRVGRLPVGLAGRAATIPFVAQGMSYAMGEDIPVRVTDAAVTAANLALSANLDSITE